MGVGLSGSSGGIAFFFLRNITPSSFSVLGSNRDYDIRGLGRSSEPVQSWETIPIRILGT